MRLINRTTRRLSLTAEGEVYLKRSREILGAIEAAEAEIQAGDLEPLFQEMQEPEDYPLWAVLPPGRQRALKVKVFLDFLMERLAAAPWRATARIGGPPQVDDSH